MTLYFRRLLCCRRCNAATVLTVLMVLCVVRLCLHFITVQRLRLIAADQKDSQWSSKEASPSESYVHLPHLFLNHERSIWTPRLGSGYDSVEINAPLNLKTLLLQTVDLNAVIVNESQRAWPTSHSELVEAFKKDVVIRYPPFQIKRPNFHNLDDWKVFSGRQHHKDLMAPVPSHLLQGVISLVFNASVTSRQSCGWMTNASEFQTTSKQNGVQTKFPLLCPVLVPEGNSFQHFIDGVLPKLVQALPLLTNLQRANLTLLLPSQSRDELVIEMMAKLGFKSGQIYWSRSKSYGADVMISACNTPPLHPLLWQKARSFLGGPESLQVPFDKSHVILLTRAHSRNKGRHIVNFDQVASFLLERYGSRLVIFQGGYTLEQTVSLFGKAGIVIGVHGGAFYNIQFSPSNTVVIEFMPTRADGTITPHLAHTIIWVMADMLGQSYWRLPVSPINKASDVQISLQVLSDVLTHVDNKNITDRE